MDCLKSDSVVGDKIKRIGQLCHAMVIPLPHLKPHLNHQRKTVKLRSRDERQISRIQDGTFR